MVKKLKIFIKFILAIFSIVFWKLNYLKNTNKPVAFLFNISRWKQPFIPNFLKEYHCRFVPFSRRLKYLKYELEKYPNKVFIVWGFNNDDEICEYAKVNGIPIYRMEDGFIRSKGLGSMHTPPYSICLDQKGMYFDSGQPSDLEDILNNYDFSKDKQLLIRARNSINKLIELGVSKYNHVGQKDVNQVYGEKTKKRILVIGQVEDDASIMRGCSNKITNNGLVNIAYNENPDAEIIYKPHPDVLMGRRAKQSDPNKIKHIAKVIEEPLSLVDSFKTIDHIYTITSLSGFEALMRGIPVTTYGAPFYSGWGLTDDRQRVSRRQRQLSIEELFAAAYIIYPRYADPNTGESLKLEEVISAISTK